MAIELKLMHGTTTVSLKASANSGWRLASGGWFPVSAPMGSDEPVVETINLVCDATSHNALATDAQDLDYMRYWAHQYMIDPTSEDPVWLHAQMQTETGARRAMVTSIEMDWLDPLLETDTGAQAENEVRAQLKITRMPWWERTALKYTVSDSETAAAAIKHDYTNNGAANNTPVGDLPARIYYTVIGTDATSADVARLWMGLRGTTKHGTLANFVEIWECEKGTNNPSENGVTDDTTTDVNGASPGSGSGIFVKLIPTDLTWDDTWNEVMDLQLQNISTNENDNFGDYLWLLRHKLSAASTWELQLRWGYAGMLDADFVRGPIVETTATSWDYAEMGRMSIPLRNLHAFPVSLLGDASETTYQVQIWARRTTSSDNEHLYLDCLCPIPLDEGWLKSWDFTIANNAADAWIWATDGVTEQALVYDTGSQMQHVAAIASDGWALPVGQGRIIAVYADTSSHALTQGGITIEAMGFYDRWANLRGSE